MNVKELSERLASRADDVAQYLLPRGKRQGREWKAGSTTGEEGASLSVCLVGEKAGRWKDFAGGEGGDLVDLWMACRALDPNMPVPEMAAPVDDVAGVPGVVANTSPTSPPVPQEPPGSMTGIETQSTTDNLPQ